MAPRSSRRLAGTTKSARASGHLRSVVTSLNRYTAGLWRTIVFVAIRVLEHSLHSLYDEQRDIPQFPPVYRFTSRELMTPKEVLALCRESEVRAVDLRFMDFPGREAFHHSRQTLDRTCFEEGLASTARASAAGRRSTKATCSSCRSRKRPFSTPSPAAHAGDDLQHPGPDHARGLFAAIRATSPAKPSTI